MNMKSKTLHPKLLKNLYDLRHERYLQKCHATVNISLAIWLAFLGGCITYIFQDKNNWSNTFLIFILVGTSVIASISFFLYKMFKGIRFRTIKLIKSLEPFANSL
jgi:uncharacterized membrane protein YbhN (UPF0104 family)